MTSSKLISRKNINESCQYLAHTETRKSFSLQKKPLKTRACLSLYVVHYTPHTQTTWADDNKINLLKSLHVAENQTVSMTAVTHRRRRPTPAQFVTRVVHPMSYCLITRIASLLMVTLRLFRGRSSWHPECSPLFHHAHPWYSLFSLDEDGLLNKAINMTACGVALWLLSRYTAVAIDGDELLLMNLLCSQVSHTKELLRGT